jgi:hypothetical protein
MPLPNDKYTQNETREKVVIRMSEVQTWSFNALSMYGGMGMIEVGHNFEFDHELKSYDLTNHVFADLLVPLNGKLKKPIRFFNGLSPYFSHMDPN